MTKIKERKFNHVQGLYELSLDNGDSILLTETQEREIAEGTLTEIDSVNEKIYFIHYAEAEYSDDLQEIEELEELKWQTLSLKERHTR